MDNNRGSNELLLLFDAIGLLLTTVALMLIYSKITNTLDINLIIASLFFFGVKLLLMGIADITGIGEKIGFGILFVLAADLILLAINLLMAFGIANVLLLISTGADLLVIVLIRVIRNSRYQKRSADQKKAVRNQDPFAGIALEEDDSDKFQNEDPSKEEGLFLDAWAASNQPTVSQGGDFLQDDTIEQDDVFFGTNTERIDAGATDAQNNYSDLELLDEEPFEQKSPSTPCDMPSKTETPEPAAEANVLRSSDIPNLDALDAFLSDSEPEVVSEPAPAPEAEPKAETVQEEGIGMEDFGSEIARQIRELHERLDALEAREAKLKAREMELEKSRQKSIGLKPQEVVVNMGGEEIIISEEDRELLMAHRQKSHE